jgi:hypothetical protein
VLPWPRLAVQFATEPPLPTCPASETNYYKANGVVKITMPTVTLAPRILDFIVDSQKRYYEVSSMQTVFHSELLQQAVKARETAESAAADQQRSGMLGIPSFSRSWLVTINSDEVDRVRPPPADGAEAAAARLGSHWILLCNPPVKVQCHIKMSPTSILWSQQYRIADGAEIRSGQSITASFEMLTVKALYAGQCAGRGPAFEAAIKAASAHVARTLPETRLDQRGRAKLPSKGDEEPDPHAVLTLVVNVASLSSSIDYSQYKDLQTIQRDWYDKEKLFHFAFKREARQPNGGRSGDGGRSFQDQSVRSHSQTYTAGPVLVDDGTDSGEASSSDEGGTDSSSDGSSAKRLLEEVDHHDDDDSSGGGGGAAAGNTSAFARRSHFNPRPSSVGSSSVRSRNGSVTSTDDALSAAESDSKETILFIVRCQKIEATASMDAILGSVSVEIEDTHVRGQAHFGVPSSGMANVFIGRLRMSDPDTVDPLAEEDEQCEDVQRDGGEAGGQTDALRPASGGQQRSTRRKTGMIRGEVVAEQILAGVAYVRPSFQSELAESALLRANLRVARVSAHMRDAVTTVLFVDMSDLKASVVDTVDKSKMHADGPRQRHPNPRHRNPYQRKRQKEVPSSSSRLKTSYVGGGAGARAKAVGQAPGLRFKNHTQIEFDTVHTIFTTDAAPHVTRLVERVAVFVRGAGASSADSGGSRGEGDGETESETSASAHGPFSPLHNPPTEPGNPGSIRIQGQTISVAAYQRVFTERDWLLLDVPNGFRLHFECTPGEPTQRLEFELGEEGADELRGLAVINAKAKGGPSGPRRLNSTQLCKGHMLNHTLLPAEKSVVIMVPWSHTASTMEVPASVRGGSTVECKFMVDFHGKSVQVSLSLNEYIPVKDLVQMIQARANHRAAPTDVVDDAELLTETDRRYTYALMKTIELVSDAAVAGGASATGSGGSRFEGGAGAAAAAAAAVAAATTGGRGDGEPGGGESGSPASGGAASGGAASGAAAPTLVVAEALFDFKPSLKPVGSGSGSTNTVSVKWLVQNIVSDVKTDEDFDKWMQDLTLKYVHTGLHVPLSTLLERFGAQLTHNVPELSVAGHHAVLERRPPAGGQLNPSIPFATLDGTFQSARDDSLRSPSGRSWPLSFGQISRQSSTMSSGGASFYSIDSQHHSPLAAVAAGRHGTAPAAVGNGRQVGGRPALLGLGLGRVDEQAGRTLPHSFRSTANTRRKRMMPQPSPATSSRLGRSPASPYPWLPRDAQRQATPPPAPGSI